jgi:radical SAM superfamily enzyme YgiQ (UPF0313 family)
MTVLLLSTYDLGRQPFGLASPAAWLRRAGVTVLTRDLSRERLDEGDVRRASLVAFYLPMHTATRLALPAIDGVRRANASARIVAYGLYAPLSEAVLREHGVQTILGPEAEADVVALATGAEPDADRRLAQTPRSIPRLAFIVPDRNGLLPPGRYATLQMPDGSRRQAGSTEATRGCKHRCRHCPIVPVYKGQFRVISPDVVLADVEQQVTAGVEHITFGDPDFFNGPTHARRIVEALHERFPRLTYDVTIKIEHLLKHRDLLPVLARTGCLFITSAVESIDDAVLQRLQKGHSRADFFEAVRCCEAVSVTMAPTFVAFTPWTTLESYRDFVRTIDALDLVDHVAPVQWGLRLLVTQGSRLLELEDIRTRVKPFDAATLTYPWRHDDPQVDRLQAEIMDVVGTTQYRPRGEMFDTVCALAGVAGVRDRHLPARATIPYLNEPWYC